MIPVHVSVHIHWGWVVGELVQVRSGEVAAKRERTDELRQSTQKLHL